MLNRLRVFLIIYIQQLLNNNNNNKLNTNIQDPGPSQSAGKNYIE